MIQPPDDEPSSPAPPRAGAAVVAAPDAELRDLVAIARAAAELVLGHFRRGIAVDLKGPGDPVTCADREANEAICESLARRFPDAGIVAEESAPTPGAALAEVTRARRVFFVDPLDGTREFVAGIAEFAVMIGLTEHGAPTAGVLALPTEQVVFAGRVGVGAWRFDAADRAVAVRLGDVAERSPLSVVVSRSNTPVLAPAVMRGLGAHRLLVCGSVGVKAARLLMGDADLYLHQGPGLKLWDSCGPEAVIRSAGGAVTDWHGSAIEYATSVIGVPRGMAAGCPALHRRILPALRAAAGVG